MGGGALVPTGSLHLCRPRAHGEGAQGGGEAVGHLLPLQPLLPPVACCPAHRRLLARVAQPSEAAVRAVVAAGPHLLPPLHAHTCLPAPAPLAAMRALLLVWGAAGLLHASPRPQGTNPATPTEHAPDTTVKEADRYRGAQ